MAKVLFKNSVYGSEIQDEFPDYTAVRKPSHFLVGVLTWLREECEGDVVIGPSHYFFKKGTDATLYKLSIGL